MLRLCSNENYMFVLIRFSKGSVGFFYIYAIYFE